MVVLKLNYFTNTTITTSILKDIQNQDVEMEGHTKKMRHAVRSYRTVMFWDGLRGAIPLALVLGLPPDFEHRVLLLDLTLGVVLFSLLVQGTTIGKLLKTFNLGKGS